METSIQISKTLLNKLKQMKLHEKESYEDLIWDLIEDRMQLSEEKIKHILKKYKEMFEILDMYDKTREWPIGRARLDVTLSKRNI